MGGLLKVSTGYDADWCFARKVLVHISIEIKEICERCDFWLDFQNYYDEFWI